MDLADKNSFIKGVVGWVDLQFPQVEEQLARYAKHPLFKGVRHVVQSEPDDRFLMRDSFQHGIRQLSNFRLTYDILVFPQQLPAVVEFIGTFPDQPFVLDHLAKPNIKEGNIEKWKEYMYEIAQFPLVMCKLSGMVTEADWENWKAEDLFPYIVVAYDAFGPNRLMIGSDWPVCLLAGNYSTVMNSTLQFIKQLPIDEQSMILGGNAGRFYRL